MLELHRIDTVMNASAKQDDFVAVVML